MRVNRNRTRLAWLLLATSLTAVSTQAISAQAISAQEGDGLNGFFSSVTTAWVSGLFFSNAAYAVSYQDLTYAVRELENRSRRFIEQLGRQVDYRDYGSAQDDVRRAFRPRVQRFQQTVQQLLRKTQYHQQIYRLRHLLERIQLQADDIELDLPWIDGYRQLRRPWRRVKTSLRWVGNLFARANSGNGSIRQEPDTNPQPPRSHPRPSPTPRPRPRPTHYPTWDEIRADNDIIEDYSERARNAFLAQMSTDYQLRRQTWARKARDQFIGFDQSANQLRKIVYSRPRNPGAAVAATVRQMLAQRSLIDQLIKGQNVNGETRKYWSVIGEKLDHLSCLLVLDGCPQ
ncbi:MAG TPA: hypothetical protein ENI62_09915 [Gammaproteobacteria bacterium]|nr:hypothetical protein [Gammaproteobacteria bacterium]